MKSIPYRILQRGARAAVLLAAAGLVAPAVHAQYKVVGPDGKITYTDRAPATPAGKVSSIGNAEPSAPAAVLPSELQQPVARYPVVLYVSGSVCASCDGGRDLLRQRGIPFTEKQVLNASDGAAFERLTGARDVPVLTIGAQILRGLSAEVWNSYLDAAAYPRSSRLPATYEYAAPTPLTQRQDSLASRGNAPGAGGAISLPPIPAAPPPAPAASGIRF
ncbi:MAG: glutaredoxin family protein [Burkholderiaceae bacterium]